MTTLQRWDLHSKLVMTAGLDETLRHAGVDVDPRSLRARTVDLPATARQADLVFASEDGSTVVHVEVQQRPDPAIGRRMTGYAARIAEHPDYAGRVRDLRQVVVQVTGSRPMDTSFRLGWLSNVAALVHIPSMPVDDLLATAHLAPFAMVRGGPDVVTAVVERIAAADTVDLRVAMTALAIGLGPPHAGAIMEELRRNDMTDVIQELSRTDWGRGLIAQGREEGREEGRQEGREEGRREGREEGRRTGVHEGRLDGLLTAVREILRTRFPDASTHAVRHTATRLAVEAGSDAVRTALVLDRLDEPAAA